MIDLADVAALEIEPEREQNRRRPYTHEECVALAKTWCEQTGAPPTRREWSPAAQLKQIRKLLARIHLLNDSVDRYRDGGYPSEVTVRKLFGSWNAFIHSCGWEPRAVGRQRIQSAVEPPPTPTRDQVARGAGEHVDAKRRAELVDRAEHEGVGAAVLAARIRAVSIASKDGDPDWLAGELEGLAGVALAWVDRLRRRER